jgi:hypothetical protein
VTLSRFGLIGVQYAIKAERDSRLKRKITINEFTFACKLLSHSQSTTLNMGEFILLELMRLGQIDSVELIKIRDYFLELDVQQKGELSLEDLQSMGALALDRSLATQSREDLSASSSEIDIISAIRRNYRAFETDSSPPSVSPSIIGPSWRDGSLSDGGYPVRPERFRRDRTVTIAALEDSENPNFD